MSRQQREEGLSTFQLEQDGFKDSTSIPNCFIEQFMPKAAGEFVKIYIYILKCLEENRSELSISRIADVFNDTEKDIIRALKYWDKKGLLTLTFDGTTLTALKVNHLSDSQSGAERKIAGKEKTEAATPSEREYTGAEIEAFSSKEDIPLLLYSIQKYMGRPLTASELNKVIFFYEELGFSADLIEYLFEYCAGAGHKNIRYIEKTAIGWKQENITSVNAAKALAGTYSDECYRVLKAFGLSSRNPSRGEAEYVNRWLFSYGFDISLIELACERTISSIHQPSFEYADSILKRWKEAGISTLEKVREADAEFEKKKGQAASKNTSKTKNKFNNFNQRSYDWEELEEELFNLK